MPARARLVPAPSAPRRSLGIDELLALAMAVALAVVPNLPIVAIDAVAFTRFRNWAGFVAGLMIGALLARAHERLPSGSGPRA